MIRTKGEQWMQRQYIVAQVFSFGMLVASQAADAQSSYVTGSSPGTQTFIESETVRERSEVEVWRPFPVRQAWFTSIEMPTEDRWTKSTKQLISVSCELEKIAILKAVEYFPNDRMGDSLEQEDHSSNYEYAVPGSVGYQMVRVLCGD